MRASANAGRPDAGAVKARRSQSPTAAEASSMVAAPAVAARTSPEATTMWVTEKPVRSKPDAIPAVLWVVRVAPGGGPDTIMPTHPRPPGWFPPSGAPPPPGPAAVRPAPLPPVLCPGQAGAIAFAHDRGTGGSRSRQCLAAPGRRQRRRTGQRTGRERIAAGEHATTAATRAPDAAGRAPGSAAPGAGVPTAPEQRQGHSL